MKINAYLSFDGRCREAFEFYERVLGARIVFIQTYGESQAADATPAGHRNRVMHVTLLAGDQVLQGADAPPGQPFTQPAGFSVALHVDQASEGERLFNGLAQGGTVRMPFQATFWAKGFGMVTDQFGTPWIVNAGQTI
jgi:PhnB protein